MRRYKPAPQVYHMAAEELYASTAEICMVSTHVWDTLGAQNVGCPAALIARPGNAPPPKLGVLGWPAAPVACRVKSSERGCAADRTLALTAFGPTQNPRRSLGGYTELYGRRRHWDQMASARGASF